MRVFNHICKIENPSFCVWVLQEYSTEISTAEVHTAKFFNENFDAD